MSAHLKVDRYGDFWLTDAVRPSVTVPVTPKQGYRIDLYRDPSAGFEIPVLAASVSRESIFEAFLALLDPLGEVVDIVLETSHDSTGSQHHDLFRENVDLPVLKSHCYDFEDMLLHDGCAGIAVMSSEAPLEVQFDEHKLLVIYAPDVRPFAEILEELGIHQDPALKFITEGEHLHATNPEYRKQFDQLCYRLGVGESVERVSLE